MPRTMKAGLATVALGVALVTSGALIDQTAFASDANAHASSSPAPTATPSAPAATTSAPTATPSPTTAPCPPNLPGRRDRSDHGFPRVGPVQGTTNGGLPIVGQPFTLKLICYDKEVQHATVTFTGIAPTGSHGKPLPILDGPATFVFTGHQSMDVVDAAHSYRLDLTSLGAPAADGWHVQVRVDIAEDRSAYRILPFVIQVPVTPTPTPSPTVSPTATPTPSVLPTSESRTPTPTPTTSVEAIHEQVLPFTGPKASGPLTASGAGLVLLGALLAFLGRHRRTARH